MRYLKTFGVAAAAVLAVAASSASAVFATELYSGGVTQGAGTLGEASLKSGTSLSFSTTGGTVVNTCTGSWLSWKLTSAGGSASTTVGSVNGSGWGGCSVTTKTTALGEIEIHHYAGTTNGTVTFKGFEVTMMLFKDTSCVYTFGVGTDAGAIIGGAPAEIAINAIVSKTPSSPFICPADIKWVGEYEVTKPAKTVVEAS